MDFLFVCEVALYDTCCCHKSYFHLVVNTTQPFPLLSLFQRIFNWHLKFQVAFNIDASTPCAVLMKLGFYKITLWLIRKSGPWWHFQLFSWKSAKYCGKRRPEEEKVAPNIKYKVFGNKVDKVDCSFCTLHTVLFALHWPKMCWKVSVLCQKWSLVVFRVGNVQWVIEEMCAWTMWRECDVVLVH